MSDDLQLLRKALWPLAVAYGLVTAVRNWLFDAGVRRVHAVAVPVVAVGNLAAGGTGKTPLVVWLVERARAAGLRPGVLARGYGRAPGEALNDEGKLLARRFPGLVQVQDPDRVRGARALVAKGVDLIVADDAFQHRRLHRDWDLVCLDTARPFAGGILPVGDLREYPKGLRRASAVVFTRAGGCAEELVSGRLEAVRAYLRPEAVAFAADHVPARLLRMPAGTDVELEAIRGRRVVLLSAIARPESFAATVAALGATVVGHERRRDHHVHTSREVAAAADLAARHDAILLTTEKDEVKLTGMDAPRLVLELHLLFLGSAPATAGDAATFLSFPKNKRP